MANRNYQSQFSYSWERMAVRLMGSFEQTDLGAFASRVLQGITVTANEMGSDGNNITVAFTGGGTAGSEVVTVSDTAISVQIESGVSTVTQVRTAINADSEAAELVTASGTSASTVSTASALPLQNGDDTDFDSSTSGMSLRQIGTGTFEISLPDPYAALIGASIMLQTASATDLMSQIESVDVTDEQTIVFRMQGGSTPADLSNGDVLYISLELRNSSQTQ